MRCKFSGLCAVPNAMFRAEVLSLKAFKNTGREDFIQQIGHPQVTTGNSISAYGEAHTRLTVGFIGTSSFGLHARRFRHTPPTCRALHGCSPRRSWAQVLLRTSS